MAITVNGLAVALRVSLPLDTEQTGELTRILAVSVEIVTKYAGDAPVATTDEATIRVAGYLYDAGSTTEPGAIGALDALRLSGAIPLLAPYRVHRAGLIDSGGAASTGEGSVDAVARAAAETAQNTADSKLDQSQVDSRVAAGVADWATEADTSQIPASKLGNAPASGGGGGGAPTYTQIGVTTDQSFTERFTFSNDDEVSFLAAWNANTFNGGYAFVIRWKPSSLSTGWRVATFPNIPMSAADRAVSATNSVSLFWYGFSASDDLNLQIGPTFLVLVANSGALHTTATCTIYGVSY